MIVEPEDYFEKLALRGRLINEAKEFFRSFIYDNHLLQPNLKYLEDRREIFDSSYLLLELIKLDFESFPYSKLGRLQIMMSFFSQPDLLKYSEHLNSNYKTKELIPKPILDIESYVYKNDPKQGKIDYETEKKKIRSLNEKIEEFNLKLKCQIEFLRDNIIPDIYFNQDIDTNRLESCVYEMLDTEESLIELFITEVVQNVHKNNLLSTIRRRDTKIYFYYDKNVYDEHIRQELEKIDDKKQKQLYNLTKMSIKDKIDAYYHKYLVINDKLQEIVKHGEKVKF